MRRRGARTTFCVYYLLIIFVRRPVFLIYRITIKYTKKRHDCIIDFHLNVIFNTQRRFFSYSSDKAQFKILTSIIKGFADGFFKTLSSCEDMKNFPTDDELAAARDAAFQQCRRENISAVINCLTECNEFDVVEYDFSVRVDEAVVLVNMVSYIDGESFRVDYSESDFDGNESSIVNIGRLVGRNHSIVIRQGDWDSAFRFPLESLVHLRFLVEFVARVGDSYFTDDEFEKEIKSKSLMELMKVMFKLEP